MQGYLNCCLYLAISIVVAGLCLLSIKVNSGSDTTSQLHQQSIRAPDVEYQNTSHNATSNRIRLLCWILTDPQYLERRTRHVRDTWAQKCDVTLYMSSETDPSFPTIGLNVSKGRIHIAAKSKAAWTYVYQHYYDQADFFMKIDPDSYVVVDNLREYLSTCDPEKPDYFGHLLLFSNKWRYMSGGPGIVLTRESLRRLVVQAFTKKRNCFPDGMAEDLKTCQCLLSVGGQPRDTRDWEGRETFLMLSIEHHLLGAFPAWYVKMDMHGHPKGKDSLSKYPISFHYVGAQEMYALHWLLGGDERHLSADEGTTGQLRFIGNSI